MAGECFEITAERSTVTVCRHKHMLFCCNLLHETAGKQSIILSISLTIAFSRFPNNISCGDARNFTRRCCTVAHLQQNKTQPNLQPHIVVLQLFLTHRDFWTFFSSSGALPTKRCNLGPIKCASSVFRTGEQNSIKFDIVKFNRNLRTHFNIGLSEIQKISGNVGHFTGRPTNKC